MGKVLGKRIAIFRVIGSRKVLVGLATSCDVDLQTDMIEMASLSQFRSYKAGRSGGTISISRLFSSSDSFSFMALQLAKTPISYVVELDDMTISGEAYISSQQANSPSQGYASHSITLTCTGDINVDAGYISFDDSVAASLCAEKFGDGVGTTIGMAEDVKMLSSFSGTSINQFRELEHFTGISSIPASTFNGCSSLKSIVIPGNVMSIGDGAFKGCTTLSYLELRAGDTLAIGRNDVESGMFRQCALDYVQIFRDVTFAFSVEAGRSPFYGSRIKVLVVAGNATKVPNFLCYGCPSLYEVILDSGIKEIGNYAFSACYALTGNIRIPSSVTRIGAYAFQSTNLSSVTMKASVPPTLESGAIPTGTIVYVPKGSAEAYRSATNWSALNIQYES